MEAEDLVVRIGKVKMSKLYLERPSVVKTMEDFGVDDDEER